MVNLDNLRRWTQELRTTTRGQTTGYLGQVQAVNADGTLVIGNCCLGIGTELAGVQPDDTTYVTEDGHEREPYAGDILDYLGNQEFPPEAFYEWLEVASESTGDLLIDWPKDESGMPYYTCRDGEEPMLWSASNLNDRLHLTFSQIADVIDYFGVRNA